jgi:hypothetical protein
LISVAPTEGDFPGAINALFLDSDGNESLRIDGNSWKGAMRSWDTEVVGPRISVRKRRGEFSVRLRLEPPGRIVIEHLDMRVADAHVLASEKTYALGRYRAENEIIWFHAGRFAMGAPLDDAAAIEFLTPYEAEWRDQMWIGKGQRLAAQDGQHVMQTGLGVTDKRLGIIIAAGCLRFQLPEFVGGEKRPLAQMRRCVFAKPDKVPEFIATGRL